MQNLPRPLGLGQPIKPLWGLIATVEVIPDFILHNLAHKFIDDIAACIEKSGFNRAGMVVESAIIDEWINITSTYSNHPWRDEILAGLTMIERRGIAYE